ncbi:MAG: rod shape-determining protein MreC [Acidobacteriia bacterium]|nr:rod shape-determining protein MreC [Terriglobia bacterium]
MMAIPARHKSLTLLAGVVAVQLLLLAVQIRREGQVRLIRVWAVELVSPLQRLSSWVVNGIGHGWGGYVGLRHARDDNETLRAELDRLKIRNAELEGRALEADRLAALLNFRNAHTEVSMLAARVIGGSPDSNSQLVYISRGSREGIRRDMGVITPDGVVGKVVAVFPDTSQVLLLGDKDSGVGALLADTRTQGPVKGTGEPLLDLEYISNDEKVSPGEAVLTSGQDRIFPKDLPVGTVADVSPDRKTPFMKIRVKPAAHLDRLEEVLVLLTRDDLNLKKESDAKTEALPAKPPVKTASAPAEAAAKAPAKSAPKPPAKVPVKAPVETPEVTPAVTPAPAAPEPQ